MAGRGGVQEVAADAVVDASAVFPVQVSVWSQAVVVQVSVWSPAVEGATIGGGCWAAVVAPGQRYVFAIPRHAGVPALALACALAAFSNGSLVPGGHVSHRVHSHI